MVDKQAAAAALDAFLRAIGRAEEPEIAGTGARVTDMFVDELCAGYAIDTRALVEESALDGKPGTLVIVRDVHVVTMCPHHLLPAMGSATVAFESGTRLVGLGAMAQLVDAHARRLVLQEHLGEGVVDALDAVLAPRWVGCRLVLSHGCMIARGERAIGSRVETVALRCPPERVMEVHALLGVGQGAGGNG
jgi:GTP cyclohydrolase I